MMCYSKLGQRAKAVELYEKLRQTLHRELAVEPAAETTRVYLAIVAADRYLKSGTTPATSDDISDAVTALQTSLKAMQREQSEMHRTLESLNFLLESGRPRSE